MGESPERLKSNTSIYSGIVRLLDLALGSADGASHHLYFLAPDDRESEVRVQLARPAFKRSEKLHVRLLPYCELEAHRQTMAQSIKA